MPYFHAESTKCQNKLLIRLPNEMHCCLTQPHTTTKPKIHRTSHFPHRWFKWHLINFWHMHFHSDHKEIREIFPRRFWSYAIALLPGQAATLYCHYSYGPRAHIAVPYSDDALPWLLFSSFFFGLFFFILLRNSFDMMYEDTTKIKSSFDAMANRVDAIYLVYLPTWAILLSNLTIMYLNYDVFCVFCVDIGREPGMSFIA